MQQALEKKGMLMTHGDALQEVMVRDKRDSSRAQDPLIKPEEAIEIDNTGLSRRDTLQKIMTYMNVD